MTIDEQLLETLHQLPPDLQAEVVDFAAFLRYRAPHRSHPEAIQPEPLPVLSGRVPPGWKDAIHEPC
ncbi:DUF2281 domain-containing protein [Candidatus Thiodictyon syntrophicum]|jgi:hypothetical protein|uniref:DUF2281 domain-containing protein n=1 Tax=Candidatus Thiodictyon syntrophicum TaxID=1166950 RepID=A0A2K8UFK8_9GAMM|nr:DUF2281 domain-containing protein [Candidatus Thiodictyon syntrophicum]AUB84374.1 hypothetical protein THSYN_27850 [Candidatus Thiodictyon syntrophicum]